MPSPKSERSWEEISLVSLYRITSAPEKEPYLAWIYMIRVWNIRYFVQGGERDLAAAARDQSARDFLWAVKTLAKDEIDLCSKARFVDLIARTHQDDGSHAVAMAFAALEWDRLRLGCDLTRAMQNDGGPLLDEMMPADWQPMSMDLDTAVRACEKRKMSISERARSIEIGLRGLASALQRNDHELARARRAFAVEEMIDLAAIPATDLRELRVKLKCYDAVKSAPAGADDMAMAMVFAAIKLDLATLEHGPPAKHPCIETGSRSLH